MIFQGSKPRYPVRDESVLAGGLLLIAIFEWPYGYYQFLRWAIMILAISIVIARPKSSGRWLIFFGLFVAALFNPFLKVSFDRAVWQLIDFALALAFLAIGFSVREEVESDEDDLLEGTLDGETSTDHRDQ